MQDYELQLVAYKAQVEPHVSPLKKTKLDSASDTIIQEVHFLFFSNKVTINAKQTYKCMFSLSPFASM